MSRFPLALFGAALAAAVATASNPLPTALAAPADDCAKWLKGRKQTVACIGNVVGPQTCPTSSGPGIREALTALLTDRGIEVKERAAVALRVEYKPKEVADRGGDGPRTRLVVVLRVVFIDQRENELADIDWKVEHEEAVAFILGLTFDRKNKFDAAADSSLAVQFFQPKTHFDGGVVLAGPDSLFGMEVRLNRKSVTPEDRDGLAYAVIPKEQEYTVWLVNRSDAEVAVRLTVDGLSVFTFCEQRQPDRLGDKPNPKKGQPLFDHILIPARSETEVPGWVVTPKKTLGFRVTEYPKTAAAQLSRDDLPAGTLTATFSAAWTGDTPPADEPPAARGPGDDGTGFGTPKQVDARPVERKIGAVRAAVSVRYTQPK